MRRAVLALLQYLNIYLVVGFLFMTSLVAGRISDRTRIPALLLFIIVGMLAGSDGPGGIDFSNAEMANEIGSLALMFILFSGGFETSWREIRPVLPIGTLLATLGVFLTAVFLAVFAWLFLGFTPIQGMLLGSIISSTDAAAVFSILRNQKCGLKGNLKPLLEFESGSNDPMAIFLTLSVLGYIKNPDTSITMLFLRFIVQMIFGGLLGYICGRAAGYLADRMRITNESMYPVFGISIVLSTFGLSTTLGGNGFLAVYICGIVMGNGDFLYKHSLEKFHAGLANIMQIGMFLILGLLVNPGELRGVAVAGLLVSAFLMLIARPLTIFLTMIKTSYSRNEKILIGWTGLRGAVPIILATYPLLDHYPQAGYIFNLIFFVVITSVFLQGQTLTLAARWLHLDVPFKPSPKYPLEYNRTTESSREETREVEIDKDSAVAGACVQDLHFPENVTILLINRGEKFLIPKGDTDIRPGDILLLLGEKQNLAPVIRQLEERIKAG